VQVTHEALTNVARHAGATSVRVSVRAAESEVVLQVEDDGVGMDLALARGGVVNMQERAGDAGGSLEVAPGSSGRGTTLTWRVPLAG
jgi:signal transduction histidine kinase